jgi:hypothetical protein
VNNRMSFVFFEVNQEKQFHDPHLIFPNPYTPEEICVSCILFFRKVNVNRP